MFRNGEEEIYCPNCRRPYFRYAPMNSVFCVCHITFVFSIDRGPGIKIDPPKKRIPVPKAFYDAFEQERDF